MKNNVVIPQYLFDELIEYFSDKSDADNGTPNKEMKLLSQLQEDYSVREIENNKTLPKEIEDYVEKQGLNFPVDMYYISMIKSMIKEAAIFGYSLRESKGCEWVKCSDDLPPSLTVVLGFSPDWVDEDYEPEGIREAFMQDDGDWLSARWNNSMDEWITDDETKPTHWMRRPNNPTKQPESNSTDELRKELEDEKELGKESVKTIDFLQNENDRLREALQYILANPLDYHFIEMKAKEALNTHNL